MSCMLTSVSALFGYSSCDVAALPGVLSPCLTRLAPPLAGVLEVGTADVEVQVITEELPETPPTANTSSTDTAVQTEGEEATDDAGDEEFPFQFQRVGVLLLLQLCTSSGCIFSCSCSCSSCCSFSCCFGGGGVQEALGSRPLRLCFGAVRCYLGCVPYGSMGRICVGRRSESCSYGVHRLFCVHHRGASFARVVLIITRASSLPHVLPSGTHPPQHPHHP